MTTGILGFDVSEFSRGGGGSFERLSIFISPRNIKEGLYLRMQNTFSRNDINSSTLPVGVVYMVATTMYDMFTNNRSTFSIIVVRLFMI